MGKQVKKFAAIGKMADAVPSCTLAFRSVTTLPSPDRESKRAEAKAILIRLVVRRYLEQQNLNKVAA